MSFFYKLRIYIISYLSRSYLWRDLFRQPYRLLQLCRRREKISAFTMCRDTVVTFEQAFEVISNVIPLDNSYRSSDFSVPVIPPNFPGGANSVFLYRLVLALKPSFVIETGVGFGISSSAILKALFANSHGYLYSIDRPAFLNQREDSDVGLAVDTSLRSRWILHYGVDRDLLPKVLHHIKPSRPFIFHYDSDELFWRQWAFNLILKYSPSGTVLISDDSSDNFSFFDFLPTKSSYTLFNQL